MKFKYKKYDLKIIRKAKKELKKHYQIIENLLMAEKKKKRKFELHPELLALRMEMLSPENEDFDLEDEIEKIDRNNFLGVSPSFF